MNKIFETRMMVLLFNQSEYQGVLYWETLLYVHLWFKPTCCQL